MKKLIETLKTIYKNEDLRSRILTTLGLVLVYLLGTVIVLPGINPKELTNLTDQASREGLLGLINMFSGGAFSRASVFALGIMPYISASIVVQLFGIVIPYFQRLQREGESGRKKITQITRYLTVLITAAQASSYLANLKYTLPAEAFCVSGGFFWVSSVIMLIAGTMFIMWLGERITDKGIGNGISLLIMIGIVNRFPEAFAQEFTARVGGVGQILLFLVELFVMACVISFTILLVQGVRRIPVQYAKRIIGNKLYGGVSQSLPIKVNAAGVMPIIFAQAIMFMPMAFSGFTSSHDSPILMAFTDYTGFWYNFVFALLIVVFTYFYTAITMSPVQISEELKRNNGFIPGVKPGKDTAEKIDKVMSRIALPGAIFLAIIGILPAFAMKVGVTNSFAHFFGGTSLLIMVGVILDTLQQIDSHLINRNGDGFLKKGRIKGRSNITM